MDKRTSRTFRPIGPALLEERLAPGNFLGSVGDAFSSIGKSIARPYVNLSNRITGANTHRPVTPTYTASTIRRWTVIAQVVSGEISAPPPSPIAPPPPSLPDVV